MRYMSGAVKRWSDLNVWKVVSILEFLIAVKNR